MCQRQSAITRSYFALLTYRGAIRLLLYLNGTAPGLHFALAMAHQTIRDSERLTKLSEGTCDLDDVDAVVERVVKVAVMGLTGRDLERNAAEVVGARRAR